jgi:glycosyltransferase involved in cell wall biosynthesis
MSPKPLKIAIIVDIVASYRAGFYDILFENKDLEVTVYAQNKIPGMNLNFIHDRYPNNVKLVKYICADRQKIGWQFLPFFKIFKDYDVVVVEGNPRQISHFVLATTLRIFRNKVVLWTMAHSFRGFAPTENLRLFWSKIFKYIYVYTDAEADFLRNKGFKKQYIVGMNNGLNQKKIDAAILEWNKEKLENWNKSKGFEDAMLLLSCSRLEPKNKYEFVIQALPIILEKVPNLIWCIIGKGVEEEKLRALVTSKGLDSNVRFIGEIYNETELAPWFLSSDVFVHPAAIGLSLLHSFGYGLPVVTNSNAHLHNPEYAAFEEGLTGRSFIENDIDNLASVIIKLLEDQENLAKMKPYTQIIAREKYNSEVMASRFTDIVNKAYEQRM